MSPNPESESLGTRVRTLRQNQRKTLQQVADAVGCTKAYIWELESRTGQRPSAERMLRLARHLCVSVEFLMDGSSDPVSPQDARFFQDYLALPEVERARMRRILHALEG